MFSGGEAYEAYMGRWSRKLAPPFLEFTDLAGGRVLDVGSGTGALAFAILERDPTARVVGVDLSPEYVAYATAGLDEERAARARFAEGDAQRLSCDAASFDGTVSLLVLNFVPDRDAAVRELIRVTRPGGVVAAAVWDYGAGMQMLRLFWDEAVALAPADDARDERHMPLCRPGELGSLWRAQGLVDVREEPLVIPTEFASFEDFWAPFLLGQGPGGAYVAGLSDALRRKLEGRLRERLLGEREDGPIRLTARAWAVRGTVPRG